MRVVRSKRRPRPANRDRIGGTWDLWRVEAVDALAGRASAVGYLVTDRGRTPKPLALVPHAGPSGLLLAMMVRGGPRVVRNVSRGLDACGARLGAPKLGGGFAAIAGGVGGMIRRYHARRRGEVPAELVGKLLLPVDDRGRRVAIDGEWAAGMYVRDPSLGTRSGVAFFAMTEDALREGCSVMGPYPGAAPPPSKPADPLRIFRAGQGATPAAPSAPQAGTEKSRMGGRRGCA
jgi:hypothetical protein